MKTRRDFLRISVKTLTAVGAVGAIGKFSTINAWAAPGPYQALMCVYLSGGNDSHTNPLEVTGRGSLIPTTSVDQYAATLAQWFGVAPVNLPSVLPNVNNFPVQNLGFLG